MSCFCYVNKTFLIYMQLLKNHNKEEKANERSRNPYSGDPPQNFQRSSSYGLSYRMAETSVLKSFHIRSFREKLETSVMTYS